MDDTITSPASMLERERTKICLKLKELSVPNILYTTKKNAYPTISTSAPLESLSRSEILLTATQLPIQMRLNRLQPDSRTKSFLIII